MSCQAEWFDARIRVATSTTRRQLIRSHDAWNKLYRADLFDGVRYPPGMIFEDIATTYKLLQRARRLVYVPDCLVHYRNRSGSLSNVHSMKSLVDYWLAYRERFELLGPVCEEYRRLSLSACMEAISRTWRWCAGCTRSERDGARRQMDDMQRFAKEHRREVLRDASYSKHVRFGEPVCAEPQSAAPQVPVPDDAGVPEART